MSSLWVTTLYEYLQIVDSLQEIVSSPLRAVPRYELDNVPLYEMNSRGWIAMRP